MAKAKGLGKITKALDRAADDLMVEAADVAQYTDVRSRELLRMAARTIRQINNAVQHGRAYLVTDFAKEFDNVLSMD
jgi:hypothetical protein